MLRTPIPLALCLALACTDPEPAGDGGATGDGGTADGGSAGDGGATDSGGGDGGSAGDGGRDTGDTGGAPDHSLDWTDVTPADAPAECAGTLWKASTSGTSTWGAVTLEVTLPEARSFHLDARTESESYRPVVVSFVDPSGETVFDAEPWWDVTQLFTMGAWPQGDFVNMDWPIRAEDPEFVAGDWTLTIGIMNNLGNWSSGKEAQVDLYLTTDEDLETACLYTTIVTAEGIAEDSDLMASLQTAVDRWAAVFAAYGITLVPTWTTSELDPTLDEPFTGAEVYAELAAAAGPHSLVMVVGETIGGSETILGQAANVPGPLSAYPRGVVAASWLLHAGGDGSLSSTEATFMGESMAHEAGHYMGLFHPIEFNSDYSVTWTDALDDTDTCTGWEECASLLGENLMFPWAWCMGGHCSAQDDLSEKQVGVLHRTGRAL